MPRVIQVLDRNGDRRVDRNELDLAIVSLRQLDRNRDGELSWEEMMGGPPRPPYGDRGPDGNRGPDGDRPRDNDRPPSRDYGRERESREGPPSSGPPPVEMMLRMFDRNGDKAISRDEAPERMAPAFERFDENGDGKLGADELRAMREGLTRGRTPPERRDDAGGERPRRPPAGDDE